MFTHWVEPAFAACSRRFRAAPCNWLNQHTTVWLQPKRNASQANSWLLCKPRGRSTKIRSRFKPASRSHCAVMFLGGEINVNQRSCWPSLSSRNTGAMSCRHCWVCPDSVISLIKPSYWLQSNLGLYFTSVNYGANAELPALSSGSQWGMCSALNDVWRFIKPH